MEQKFRMYPNGFLFTTNNLNAEDKFEHYKRQTILNNYNYYYDNNSEKIIYEKQDNFIIIHGIFVHLTSYGENITKESPQILLKLYINDKEKFLESLNFIGGRFIIIVGNLNNYEVYTDASSTRSVFYSNLNNTIMSHVNMMREFYDVKENTLYGINEEYSISWDVTKYDDLKSINPNHAYNSANGKVCRYFPRNKNIYETKSDIEKMELFEYLWKQQITHFSSKHSNVIFSLTGGADSRLSFSLIKEQIQKFKFFTYAPAFTLPENSTPFTKTLQRDKDIVDQILDVVPLNHRYLIFEEKKKKLTQNQLYILNKNTYRSHGRFILPHYMYHFPEENILHIQGYLLEIGRAFWIEKYQYHDNSESIRKIITPKLTKGITDTNKINMVKRDIDSNIKKFKYDQDSFGYHKVDLYYWEMWMGRWMSEVLNESDVCYETLNPFNMRALIDISLSYSYEKRKNQYLFDEIINRNFPVLNFFGKNNEKNLYEQNKFLHKDKETSIKSPHQNKLILYSSLDNKFIILHESIEEVYIPKEYLKIGNYSKFEYEFKYNTGTMTFTLKNNYKNVAAVNYLKYSLYVNEMKILEEDMALWKEDTSISITGLNKLDKIEIRVTSLRNMNTLSWESASKLIVLKAKQEKSLEKQSLNVFSSSPYSIIYN